MELMHPNKKQQEEKHSDPFGPFIGDEYHGVRPIYTVESAKYLLRKVNVLDDNDNVIVKSSSTVTILELGCGTGLLTFAMMEALKGKDTKIRYIASDPGESMRQTFAKHLPEIELVACKAEALPFPDNSVRAIVAAASYHWFATEEAYKEMYRVLEPEGMLGYITNLPSETDPNRPEWIKEMYELLWASYHKTQTPFEHDYKWRQVLLSSQLFEDYKEDLNLKMFQEIGAEQCVQMFGSFGGIASGGAQHRNKFEKDLRGVLKKYFLDKDTQFPGVYHTTEISTAKSTKKV